MKYYEINETQARRAKQMWSFSDYINGSETEDYRKRVDEAYTLCETVPDDRKEKALYYADMYAKKLAENINKGFNIELMCPSIMISGAGNFPVHKKEKQNASRDRNMQDYQYIQGYIKKIKNLIYADYIIKSGDENAIEMLKEKVKNLEEKQIYMKQANAHYKKYGTMKCYGNLTDEEAENMDKDIKSGCSWEQRPYPAYSLTNNNAKIKNTKQRLVRLENIKKKSTQESENKYFKVVENTEIMRLQLVFDGKPSEEIRSILKSNGFVWSSKNTAWQRQLTENAMSSMERVFAQIKNFMEE